LWSWSRAWLDGVCDGVGGLGGCLAALRSRSPDAVWLQLTLAVVDWLGDSVRDAVPESDGEPEADAVMLSDGVKLGSTNNVARTT